MRCTCCGSTGDEFVIFWETCARCWPGLTPPSFLRLARKKIKCFIFFASLKKRSSLSRFFDTVIIKENK